MEDLFLNVNFLIKKKGIWYVVIQSSAYLRTLTNNYVLNVLKKIKLF